MVTQSFGFSEYAKARALGAKTKQIKIMIHTEGEELSSDSQAWEMLAPESPPQSGILQRG
jgi:hypothetical protein